MTVTTTDTAPGQSVAHALQAPEDWRVTPDGTVPIADVIRTAGVPHGAIDYAVRACNVPILDQHGQGRRRYISVSEGLLLLAAAVLAVGAGVALSQMYRAIKASGATVDGAALTIPLRTAA